MTDLHIWKLTASNGTFEAPTGTLTMGFVNSGDQTDGFVINGTGAFSHNNGKILFKAENGIAWFSGKQATISAPDGVSFYDVELNLRDTNASGANGYNEYYIQIEAGTVPTILGDLTIQDGYFQGSSIVLSGDLTLNCIDGAGGDRCAGGGNSGIQFSGTANQTFTRATGADEPNGTFVVNKSSGTVALASQMDLDASGQDLQVLGGTLSLGAYDLRLDDQLTVNTPGGVDASGAGSVVYINGGCSGTGVCP